MGTPRWGVCLGTSLADYLVKYNISEYCITEQDGTTGLDMSLKSALRVGEVLRRVPQPHIAFRQYCRILQQIEQPVSASTLIFAVASQY